MYNPDFIAHSLASHARIVLCVEVFSKIFNFLTLLPYRLRCFKTEFYQNSTAEGVQPYILAYSLSSHDHTMPQDS